MIDSILAKGKFKLWIYKDNELIDFIEDNNLVVTLGKTNLTKLMGGDPTGLPITKFGVGTNGTSTAVTDVSLTDAFIKDVDNVTYPDGQSITYHFDLDNIEGNGLIIREFGLLNTADVLCARKIRDGEINKTNLIRLVGSWTITIN